MQIQSIDDLQNALRQQLYIADRGLATAAFLALKLQRPLFLEGEAGVGKTEIAKVIANLLETNLIRLQCYEGLDVNQAVYEWNYTRQMLHIRLLESRGERATEAELFGEEFLLERPL
ncbi:MAG TPA: MoxR family ATPase, partial [Anaerolineae bacterium]